MTQTTKPEETLYQGWQNIIKSYQNPVVAKSVWQIINSFGGLVIFWTLTYLSFQVSFIWTLLLTLLSAGFVVRIFIIQHDLII